jgi:formate hydrogenlyase transcriptional activator
MPPSNESRFDALRRLCQAVRLAPDLPALLQATAGAIHEITAAGRVGWVFRAGGSRPGLVVAMGPPRRCRELAATAAEIAALRAVMDRREAQVLDQGAADVSCAGNECLASQDFPVVLCLPVRCRDNVVGVLGIAAARREDVERWDQPLLEEMAGVFALGVEAVAAQDRVAELERFQREAVYLRDEMRTERDLRLLTGESTAMKAVRQAVQQVARTDSTVLVLGETGTGKELVARAIHQLSPRRDRLLVPVNCAALAPGVIASELFGHEAGAFTGATRRRLGRFELAQHGTIFLDEVGELPPETQVLLLRVLQERVIERVGGGEPLPVNVRVIAATHRDLGAALAQERFRADLYFRLNVFPIRVPPLRERREDIADLVRHFLHHFSRRLGKQVNHVSPCSLRLLTEYDWPGNVRELENLVERAMIVCPADTLEIDPSWLRPASPEQAVPPAAAGLAALERQAIVEALRRCQGRVYGPAGAAVALGLKPTTLYGRMRKHHIDRKPGAQ